jgi:hypothetical protein
MIYIKKKRFAELKKKNPDYICKAIQDHTFDGKTCRAGVDHIAFESVLTGDSTKGTTLIFEHIHFEII